MSIAEQTMKELGQKYADGSKDCHRAEMTIKAYVREVQSAQSFVDNQQRVYIQARDNSTCSMIVPNRMGLVLDQELEIVVRPAQEAPV